MILDKPQWRNEHNDGATYSDPSYVKQQVPMETSEQAPFHEEQSNMNHHPLGTSTYPLLHLFNSLISHVLCISAIMKMYCMYVLTDHIFYAFDILIYFLTIALIHSSIPQLRPKSLRTKIL